VSLLVAQLVMLQVALLVFLQVAHLVKLVVALLFFFQVAHLCWCNYIS